MNILSGMNCLLMGQYRRLGNSIIFVDGAYREVDELEVFILFIFNEQEPLYRAFAIAVTLTVVLTHQKNISRLLRGNESKVPILKHRDRRRERKRSEKE